MAGTEVATAATVGTATAATVGTVAVGTVAGASVIGIARRPGGSTTGKAWEGGQMVIFLVMKVANVVLS